MMLIIISFFFGRCNIYPKIVYFTNVLCSFLFFFYFYELTDFIKKLIELYNKNFNDFSSVPDMLKENDEDFSLEFNNFIKDGYQKDVFNVLFDYYEYQIQIEYLNELSQELEHLKIKNNVDFEEHLDLLLLKPIKLNEKDKLNKLIREITSKNKNSKITNILKYIEELKQQLVPPPSPAPTPSPPSPAPSPVLAPVLAPVPPAPLEKKTHLIYLISYSLQEKALLQLQKRDIYSPTLYNQIKFFNFFGITSIYLYRNITNNDIHSKFPNNDLSDRNYEYQKYNTKQHLLTLLTTRIETISDDDRIVFLYEGHGSIDILNKAYICLNDDEKLYPLDLLNLFTNKQNNLKLFLLTNCYSYDFLYQYKNYLENTLYFISTNNHRQSGYDAEILKAFSKLILMNLLKTGSEKKLKFSDIDDNDLNIYPFVNPKILKIYSSKGENILITDFFDKNPIPTLQEINDVLQPALRENLSAPTYPVRLITLSSLTSIYKGGNNKKQYLFKLYNCRIKIKNGEIYASTAKEAGNIIGKNIVKYSNKNKIKFTILCLNNNKFYSFKIKNNT